MTQYVLSADSHARYHSSQRKTDLFIARNVFRKESLHTNHSQFIFLIFFIPDTDY